MGVYELLNYIGSALALTITVELFVTMALVREKSYIPSIVIANILTNPLLNLLLIILTRWIGLFYALVLFVLEIGVWLMESFILKKMNHISKRKAMSVSLVMNASSYLAGVFIQI